MHGPGPKTPTNALGWEPEYPHPSSIEVVDTLALTLGPLRRIVWRQALAKGLAKWEAAGVGLVISEEPAENHLPRFYDGTVSPIFFPISGKIRIVRILDSASIADPDEHYSNSFANYAQRFDPSTGEELPGGGAVFLKPTKVWWRAYWAPALAGLIGHEIGHTLGLWHRSDGGIMAGAWSPDEHDLEAVRSFYG